MDSIEAVEEAPAGRQNGPQFLEECEPAGESRDECRARLGTLVEVQKQFWGRANQTVPEWLDADYLFQLNYGPATRYETEAAKLAVGGSLYEELPGERSKRSRVTLLDRKLALRLFKAFFPSSASTDSIFDTVPGTGNDLKNKLSPFDYDPTDPKMSPLLWTENYIVNYVWSDHYSTKVLGLVRSPMCVVVEDIISLLEYLRKVQSGDIQVSSSLPTSIFNVLRGFATSGIPRSIKGDSYDWAARGYFADMFNLVTCLHLTERPNEKDRTQLHTDIMGYNWFEKGSWRTWPQRYHFPGSDSLRLPRLQFNDSGSTMPLDHLSADFIHTGPFRITFTSSLDEHLTFNQNRELRLFLDRNFAEAVYPMFPGEMLKPFEEHALGKVLGADSLFEEVRDTYSLLFSRNTLSQDILRSLLRPRNCVVAFMNNPSPPLNGSNSSKAPSRLGSKEQTSPPKFINILLWGKDRTSPTLNDFNHFRPHIALLVKRMHDWTPSTWSDLFIRPYKDRITYFGVQFGLFVVVLAVLAFFVNVTQLVFIILGSH